MTVAEQGMMKISILLVNMSRTLLPVDEGA